MLSNTNQYVIYHGRDRGHTQLSWLDSYHTFSFGNFIHPQRMGFRSLRVINDDYIANSGGFTTHSHRDMEILTYVLSGAVEHKDSLGIGSVIPPGDVQIMSAGTGIAHSEFNPSATETLHLLQIWILPNTQGLIPRYEQKSFSTADKQGQFHLIAAPDGGNGAVTIHQDVEVYAAVLRPGDILHYHLQPHRYGWLQIAQGAIDFQGELLTVGDGVQVSGEMELQLLGNDMGAEVLLFDLA